MNENTFNEVTKKVAEIIDKAANRLPDLFHATEKEWVKVSGNSLINQGHTKLVNGEKISKDIFYDLEMPKKINHRFVMRKVYEREGMAGVVNYQRGVRKLIADEKIAKRDSIKKQIEEGYKSVKN
jgi:hypothetical protein